MTPLLLLPGMMCDARMWGSLAGRLPGRLLHHAVPCEATSVGQIASGILQAAPPRFALAGLSMGGIVAMEVLRQAPGRVERLALLDTNPFAESPEVQARRGPQMARAAAGDLAGVMCADMIPRYLPPGVRRPDIEALCLDMALSLGPAIFIAQSQALRDRPDQCATLAAWRGPALVLMGEHDVLCPRDRHETMARLMPQARLSIIPGAGHLPPLEMPRETAAELSRWLEDP